MDLTALKKIPLFRSIHEAEIEMIFSELKITETEFRKGEVLALQDELCNRLIILLSGSVKGEMTDPSGKVVKVEDIYAPSPLAILFLFGPDNRFPVQAIAREDVTALVIPKQSVLRMLSMNQTLLKNYLDISADFASRLSKKLHFMSFRTIRQKLAVYILNLSKIKQEDTIELDKTKSALAEYFGVSRQSLERELSNMQHDGLLTADKKMITITDKNRLIHIVRF
ncbi:MULTISPECIES: Crp/Fnr family transcriptional regulator [unclassified Dysgonomonas]|jgi:CRP-like cAMP-binding protein|uniref:Crp/Fnr family transcriptional regulator n=1 Tax=unclassified Dysgonomonas TaxID=2630389 RepID=UPI0025C16388|nr:MULTISPECIES: Crp/Fnr family transcriptional regulator [unclassified Dysgonomonas]MDR2003802.1 Crp/Fnr family transcriptional regulator [Prevotella sp.]HMM03240.1 Crp/Fnr family transcriptional regulator [Dysgonomonas sp.]